MSINDNVRILQKLSSHTSDVTSCDFAPNFTLITGSSDKTVRIWAWTPGSGYVEREDSPWRGHKYQVTCVRVSPQGSMVASSSVDGTAVLWNLHSGTKLYTMTQVNGDAIRVCRFAPDSSILVTAGDNGAICVWDLVHRSLIRTIFEHEGTTQSLAFTPDSQYLVSACSLEVIRVWHVQDLVDRGPKAPSTIFEHEGTTQSLAFTPDSQYLVSACSLEVIRVWHVQDLVDTGAEGPCGPVARVDNAHDLGVFSIDISPAILVDENDPLIKYYKLATSGNSNEIKIWTISSTSTPKHKNEPNTVFLDLTDVYDGHGSSVTCIRYNRSGSYLVSSSVDKMAKIWDNNGNCISTLAGHNRYVNCIAVSKDSTLIATGSNDKLVIVWDLTGEITLESELFGHRSFVGDVSSISEMQLVQNECASGVRLLERIDDIADGAINCCCFSNETVLATASGDKLVRLFRIAEDSLEEINYSPLEGHTYAVNFLDFSPDGKLLASSSQDGSTIIWDASTGERISSMPHINFSVKVCRFSLNNELIITGGDDDRATVWNVSTVQEEAVLEGHLDAITSASFSPDTKIIITTCFNSHFRIWSVEDYKTVFLKEDVHDNGIQCCDISPSLEPIPTPLFNTQMYLLATCGNDGLGKLWKISIPKKGDELDFEQVDVKLWRTLHGHGGSVICIRFSPVVGEIICSTATDRQARIWSVYSGETLYVLDHDSIVTACSFSIDCTYLAIGCLDKTLWLYEMPQQLVFQSAVAHKIKCRTKDLIDWSIQDVVKWLTDIQLEEIIENVENTSLDGKKILTFSEEEVCSALDLGDELAERFAKELKWLKQERLYPLVDGGNDIPHEFLCPITHEIMQEPVTCSDGFTYEKKAIVEWFMSGKYSSPMTNEGLISTDYTANHKLRNEIHTFLDGIDDND